MACPQPLGERSRQLLAGGRQSDRRQPAHELDDLDVTLGAAVHGLGDGLKRCSPSETQNLPVLQRVPKPARRQTADSGQGIGAGADGKDAHVGQLESVLEFLLELLVALGRELDLDAYDAELACLLEHARDVGPGGRERCRDLVLRALLHEVHVGRSGELLWVSSRPQNAPT